MFHLKSLTFVRLQQRIMIDREWSTDRVAAVPLVELNEKGFFFAAKGEIVLEMFLL